MSILKVEDLCYRYEGSDRNVLSGMNVEFEKGKTYAMTGKSGAGKSTFLSLVSALTKPTEGTMLTVGRIAAERAKIAAKANNDMVYVWSEVCGGALEALKSTPDLLPVLKKAGVVDAGGKGLCLIFEGMLSVFKDDVIISADVENARNVSDDAFRNAAAEFDGDINFTYCTEFIVKRNRLCKLKLADLV